ncbi:MAG: right-handed parallel beta-helix repeat-containing protein, partial [Promethearchaeota archaeon]
MVFKQNQKLVLFFAMILVGSVMTLFINTNFQISSNNSESSKNFDGGVLKTAGILTDFLIDDTGSDNWTWAKNNGYCTGFGTPGSPYLIQNQIFEESIASGNSLTIIHSRKYFILRNCTFRNAADTSYGLYMENVTNGVIEDCFAVNNLWSGATGIIMIDVNNTEIIDSHIHDNTNNGVHLVESHYNIIAGNNISANLAMGIYLDESTHNTILNNDLNDNTAMGILAVTQSDDNTFSDNTINKNLAYGIYFDNSHDNIVSNNDLIDNTAMGIYINGANRNTLSLNTANDHDVFGIYIEAGCENNTVSENTANNNNVFGIHGFS